jgi:hypothetical protein
MVAVGQALAVVVKQDFFNGKQDGVTEINGQYIFSFSDVAVTLDSARNKYYADLPAAYISLPHDYGVVSVSLMKSDDTPFVRMAAGQIGMITGTMAENLQGNTAYAIENARIYLPKTKVWDNTDALLVKIAVSLDGIDDDTTIFLPPDAQEALITMVMNKYNPQPPKEKLN